nr:hypothetical protein BaRGS_019435 [Batillaria attramentaria]
MSGMFIGDRPCAPGTVWDDSIRSCGFVSTTCMETTSSATTVSVLSPTTGPICITSCVGRPNGDYQSCFGCSVYASCVGGMIINNRACPGGTVWDDGLKMTVRRPYVITDRKSVVRCSHDVPTMHACAPYVLRKADARPGAGLGSREHGIKQAIKVKIKKDTTGVGHDPAKEFTHHWWDEAFNRAASSIIVETENEEVTVKTKDKKKHRKERLESAKKTLYGNFIKCSLIQSS